MIIFFEESHCWVLFFGMYIYEYYYENVDLFYINWPDMYFENGITCGAAWRYCFKIKDSCVAYVLILFFATMFGKYKRAKTSAKGDNQLKFVINIRT